MNDFEKDPTGTQRRHTISNLYTNAWPHHHGEGAGGTGPNHHTTPARAELTEFPPPPTITRSLIL